MAQPEVLACLACDFPSHDFHDSPLYADAVFLVLDCLARSPQPQYVAPLFRKCLPLLLVQRREASAEDEREAELRDACGAILAGFVRLASASLEECSPTTTDALRLDLFACLLTCRVLCGGAAVSVPASASLAPSAHEQMLAMRRSSSKRVAAGQGEPAEKQKIMLTLLSSHLRDCFSSAAAGLSCLQWSQENEKSSVVAAQIDGLLDREIEDAGRGSHEVLAARSIALARLFAAHMRDPASRGSKSSFASRNSDNLCCWVFGHAAVRLLRSTPADLNSAALSSLLPLLLHLLSTYTADEKSLAAVLAHAVVTRSSSMVLVSCQALLMPPLMLALEVCDEPGSSFLLSRAAHAYLAAITVVNTGAHNSQNGAAGGSGSASTDAQAFSHRLITVHLDQCSRGPERLVSSLLALLLALPNLHHVLVGVYSRSLADVVSAALNCFSLPTQTAAVCLVNALLREGTGGHLRPFVLPLIIEMARIFVYYSATAAAAADGSNAALHDFSAVDCEARSQLLLALRGACRTMRQTCPKEWADGVAMVLRAAANPLSCDSSLVAHLRNFSG